MNRLLISVKKRMPQAMRAALAKVKSELGREYPLVIGGERINTDAKLESINPAKRTEVVGRFQKATKEFASRAVESAYETFQTWKKTSAAKNARTSSFASPKFFANESMSCPHG